MSNSDAKILINLILNNRTIQYLSIIVLTSILASSLTVGLIPGFILVAAFITGFFTFQYIFRYQNEIDNILSILIGDGGENPIVRYSSSILKCNVCGDCKCDREEITYQKQWKGLKVPLKIDEAVSDLLQKTLNEFVTLWFREISPDNSFQQELKQVVQHGLRGVVSRGLKIDPGKLLSTKGFKVIMKHAFRLKHVSTSQKMALHPAVMSREAELSYLRSITSQILPHLLTPKNLNCKTFEVLVREILCGWLLLPFSDAVCDPFVINSLLLLLMDQHPLTVYPPTSQEDQVEFLASFVAKSQAHLSASALRPDMCTILKDQTLLYAFMQFLKTQGTVNILQFCLDVEEFNRRMLTPELSSEDLDLLYRDAWDLYSVYFSPHSPDTLNFPGPLVKQMRKVLSKDVTKLRTSPPLFQTYEHTYNLLDSVYCPQFHTSDDFYTWLCGPKMVSCPSKSGSSSPSLQGSPAKSRYGWKATDSLGAVSRLGNRLHKLKGALKAGPVAEGQSYTMETSDLSLETDTDFVEALQFESERDLSKWHVSIPDLNFKVDPTTSKLTNMITINIQRFDVPEGGHSRWTVERRITDFYSLDAKLTEFHGEFPDAQLPSRRNISNCTSPCGPESFQLYEDYLQKLLLKPALRGSDLLFSFLANPGDFVAEDSTFGRMLRRGVPLTLRKEKGQHLEPFIATFIASSESKLRYSKIEYQDLSEELLPQNIRNIITPIFGDNFGLQLPPKLPHANVTQNEIPASPTYYLIHFGVNVLRWTQTTIQFAIAVQKLFGKTLDVLFQYWLNYKIKKILVPQRIAHLIYLLKWVIYDSKRDVDRPKVAETVELLLKERSGWSKTLYEALYLAGQSPILNKQLFYCLIDELIEELFPEMNLTLQESNQK